MRLPYVLLIECAPWDTARALRRWSGHQVRLPISQDADVARRHDEIDSEAALGDEGTTDTCHLKGSITLTIPTGITLTSVTLNSPNPPALARFYAQLLGWTITTEEPGWVVLPNPTGGIGLSFHIEDHYTPPVWPSEPGKQLMMMHLEIQVENLEAASVHAQICGATLAEFQPQDDVRVHLDPDGHPFCLYL